MRQARPPRRGGVYCVRPRRRPARWALYAAAVSMAAGLLSACVGQVGRVLAPEGFGGVPCMPEPAAESRDTGDPERPYTLQTAPPYTVALDAGHGGMDTGAHSRHVEEVAVCEQTVDALYDWLEKDPNYEPVRARENGVDLSIADRVKNVTERQASLLLSIHANYDGSTRQSHGFECFPTPPGRVYSGESLRAAQCLAEAMGQAGHRLRGGNGVRFAYYYGKRKKIVDSTDTKPRAEKSFGIVEQPHCPAVLVEQCFLSNSSDYDAWASPAGCRRAGRGYYEAVCAYFGTEPLPKAQAAAPQ